MARKSYINTSVNILAIVSVSAINLILINLPLLNILSYESSVINACVISLISGFLFLYYQKSNLHLLLLPLLFLFFIPIIILSISTVLCQNCPLDDGIYFYLLFVLPSIFIAVSIALISDTITQKWRFLVYIVLWLFVLISFLPELYFNPQIYFYNPIFGYYPGVIYDQNIEITSNLISYQILNLSVSFLVIYFLHLNINFNKRTKHIIIYGFMLLFTFSFFIKPALGLSTDLNRIKSELKEEIITEHFDIIIPDTLTFEQKRILEFEHEYYYQSIEKLLETEVENKITSIIFDPGAQKKKLFGSENADVAKPWLNQIYINLDNYENSLKHEISHIFSANFSSGLFKVPLDFNPGMIEGFAMAVENDFDNLDIDYMAALAYKNGYDVSLTDLLTNYSFFANASSLSYIYAGSFFKFLADKYSWQKCNYFYSGVEFEEVFGRKIIEFEKEYKNYLLTIEIEDNEHMANYYFSRKPLIKLNCARATAKELEDARILFESRNYEEASIKYLEIYEYSKAYNAFVGFIQSKIFLEDKADAIVKLSNEISNFKGTGSYYYLEFLLADLHALNSDSSSAVMLYNNIIAQNPHPIYLRSANVKKQLLAIGDTVLRDYMINPKDKFHKILELVKENPNDYLLQTICVLLENEIESYEDLIGLIKKSTKVNSYSTETYFELSKLAYKKLDFDNAMEFGRFAYQNSELKYKSIIEDHLAKINWINHYSISQ